MGDAERWSWRWLFDGEPPGAVRRWLFALTATLFGLAGVAVTGADEPAPLAVVAIFLGQVLWQPFVSVSRLDRQHSRPGTPPVQRRPRAWYRTLLGVAAAWLVAELLILVAIARIPDRGFWWFLGVAGAVLMIVAGVISALAAWRVQRTPVQPGPTPGTQGT